MGTWKAPASSHIYYFRIPPPLAVFLPALLEPSTAHVPLGGAPTDFSPAREPVQSCQLSPTSCPLQGGGKRGRRGVAGREPHPHHMLRPLQTPSFLAGAFLRRQLSSDELREQELCRQTAEQSGATLAWPQALNSTQPWGEPACPPGQSGKGSYDFPPSGPPCRPG